MSMSFLQAVSAKVFADKLPRTHVDSPSYEQCDKGTVVEALRLLVVEEENGSSILDGNVILARSFAMELAYSLASTSTFGCRGCSDLSGEITNENNRHEATAACRCCKVALLLPGELRKTKKKRRRSANTTNSLGISRKGKSPIFFLRNEIDENEKWDPTLLEQIHIKYVTSLAEVIQFLAYAPSLPDHLQPLDGIFLLGIGELFMRQNINMELTHLRKCDSDCHQIDL